MANVEHGIQRAIIEVFTAFIIAALLRSILPLFHIEWSIILFDILSIIAIISMVSDMKYWGIGYTLGWLVGLILFISLIHPIQAALYIIIAIISFFIKMYNKLI